MQENLRRESGLLKSMLLGIGDMCDKVFSCKEEKCDQRVRYRRDPISGAMTADNSTDGKENVKIVYLTCCNGHTYPYEISE